jgi:class 3 adenylate cyclase/pimeloyl-ACP methyl ester carboxylesterase
MLMDYPETRYAAVGADRVAYQVLGSGERDVVDVMGLWTHVDVSWEEASVARFLRRLAGFARLIRFDPRGCGLSDPRPDDGRSVTEHWTEDLLAVLDTVKSKAPVFLCQLDGGVLALPFVHAHPERCSGLILANTSARFRRADDYAAGHSEKTSQKVLGLLRLRWGTDEFGAWIVPSQAGNDALRRWFSKWCRSVASPRGVATNLAATADLDVRALLPDIAVPTLVLTRRESPVFTPAQAQYLADNIPGAKLVTLPGADAMLIWEGSFEALDHIEEFVTGQRRGGEPERALASVLFTDIVDSTRLAAKQGDEAWRALLDRHDRVLREQIALFRGRFVDSAGDGSLAVFDSPGRAIDCAHSVLRTMDEFKLELRAGVHIGEVELREDGRVGGIAVHIGARVLGEARGGEVVVSRTVRDVLIGSRYKFKDRGIHELKGVPSKWPLYVAENK